MLLQNKATREDIIIAIMGPTGTGESRLIDTLGGRGRAFSGQLASSGLASYTDRVHAVRVSEPKYENQLVLVDTPGFNNTERSDLQVLGEIGDWLKKNYETGKKISGIIYTHRITDNRMTGTHRLELRMFEELCGHKAAGKVILVSTMWDKVDEAIGKVRERQLREEYWINMVKNGSTTMRSDNGCESAWNIVDHIVTNLEKNEQPVLLEEELAMSKLQLDETKAGIVLHGGRKMLLVRQLDAARQLTSQAGSADQPDLAVALMQISVGRRIALLFKRRARAEPLKVR